eukprot:CAMPEP_0201593074 /NCGR_PEP_ID=MMETSP0190_2-20130828/190794_1 /ASSEMBLY_ACC=CAM_ASM_000263 /TAXON_ID=37353 /ORGANISM="Rosalina sp." /LENGTH=359 /DNA_ID=CAMNT_0048052131 /DNA_START=538 /DNA_END=1618 /DNA_ORIENTATION=+
MPNNCAQQFDVFFNLQTQDNDDSKEEQRANDDLVDIDDEQQSEDDDDDDDDDDQYAARLNQYTKTEDSKYPDNNHKEFSSQKTFNENLLSQGIDQTMREQFKSFGKFDKFEQFSFSRFEMVFGEDSISTLTAKDTLPPLSPEITPLFRHYHTINAIKAMAVTVANILCFSCHVFSTCIQLFCYIYADGKIHGQRVSLSGTEDLDTILGALYPNSKITRPSMEISKMEISDDIESNKGAMFGNDPTYEEYKLVLYPKRICVEKEYTESQQNEQKEILIKMDEQVEMDTKRLNAIGQYKFSNESSVTGQRDVSTKVDEQRDVECKQDDVKEDQNEYIPNIHDEESDQVDQKLKYQNNYYKN